MLEVARTGTDTEEEGEGKSEEAAAFCPHSEHRSRNTFLSLRNMNISQSQNEIQIHFKTNSATDFCGLILIQSRSQQIFEGSKTHVGLVASRTHLLRFLQPLTF